MLDTRTIKGEIKSRTRSHHQQMLAEYMDIGRVRNSHLKQYSRDSLFIYEFMEAFSGYSSC